jgi:hypothetical protein
MTHGKFVDDSIRSSSSHVKTKAVRELPDDEKLTRQRGWHTFESGDVIRSRRCHLQQHYRYNP